MPDSQIAYSAGTETPLKFSPATTMGRLPSLAQEGLEAVEKIIPFLRMVSTESLLKKFTPDKDVATVLQTLKQNGTYGGGAWTKFPDPNSGKILERDLYEPFVETANEIASAFGRSTVNAVWINRANKTPESSIKGAAKIRPDCLSATSPELAELDSQIRELENELEALTRNTHAYVKAAKLAEISSKKNKLLQKLNLWWRQAQVPMEWKLEENEEPLQPSDPVVLQALSYMRWMLAEQLDRRFVLGLIVCYNQLTILFSDRSGTLMANSPINIHEKPLDFIRVIGGIRCMSPEQLGWDTRMLLYKNVDQTIVPSYNAGADYKGVYGDTHYHLHWVIDVTVNRKVEQFLTARIISSVRAQGMCGRATLVFEVIKYNERSNPRKTWILKRYWRPNNDPEDPAYPTEGQFYEILGHDAKDLRPKFDFTYHDITTSGGQVDNTFSTIRAGITSGLPHSKSIAPHGKLVQEDEPEAELSLHVKITDPSLAEPMVPHSRYEPVDRVHNQILLPTDHHRAHEKGVIHRDVSIGNLMIFLRNADDFKDTFGRLIDFDHAKRVSGTIALPRNDYPEQILESTQVQVRYSTNFEVTTDTAQKACDYVGMLSAAYLEDVTKFMVQFQSTQKEGALTPADLGWFDGDVNWPDFSNCVPRKGERTGTLPFMAPEVLSGGAQTICKLTNTTPFWHNSVHDVESFLWVLVYICLTRRGPGMAMIRDEFLNGFGAVYICAYKYFDNDSPTELAQAKFSLFTHPQLFQSEIVDHFHPYFEGLKGLVSRWWRLLILAYTYHGNEYYYIHNHIIRILEKTIADLQDPETPHQDTIDELLRRKEHHERVLGTFRRNTTAIKIESRTSVDADSDDALSDAPEHLSSVTGQPVHHAVHPPAYHPPPDLSTNRPIKKARRET